MQRREFIARLAAMGLGAAAGIAFGEDAPEPAPSLPRRELRPGGPELSIVGFGGMLLPGMEQQQANDIVAWAYDRGVTYYDVAPTYGDAQDLLGPALEPYRDNCFLACKTLERDAEGAREELEGSLQALRTDHFDLYQLHALRTAEDVEQVTAPGGALETFVAAREEGLVRHLGFSAHTEEAAVAVMDRFDFDTTLFPINCVCVERGEFGPAVIEKAAERDVSILAIKSLAWTRVPQGQQKPYPNCWYQPIEDPDLGRLALSYTLDRSTVAAVSPAAAELLMLAVEIGLRYRPLSDAERARLIARTQGIQPIFPQ
ncbi:MAG: aldo/keto reductase [Armatimonadota bacterium]|nr:aldo/keto reductase [Armatimonadota bacterium]